MTSRVILTAALFAALAMPAYVGGHPGHAHKVMGAVARLHEAHIEVKASDGKTSTIKLTEKTKIIRGKTRAKPDDIKIGERVVVTAVETKDNDGKTTLVATEIRLATPAATTTK